MGALWTIVVLAFVLAVFAVLAYGLFEVTKFCDPRAGGRRWQSPHLETWDEFERTHEWTSPHLESHEEFERTVRA